MQVQGQVFHVQAGLTCSGSGLPFCVWFSVIKVANSVLESEFRACWWSFVLVLWMWHTALIDSLKAWEAGLGSDKLHVSSSICTV